MNLFMADPIDEEESLEESDMNQNKLKNWKPAKF
jgi:hypothetical protein